MRSKLLFTLAVLLAIPAIALAGKGSDGDYEGRATNVGNKALDQVAITFDVTRKGRRIKHWVARFNAGCATFPASVEFVTQPMSTMRVKRRSGRFHEVFRRRIDGTRARVEVSGKLEGKRVKRGRFSYRVGPCSRGDGEEPIRWKAERSRRLDR